MSEMKIKEWIIIEYKREGDKEWRLLRTMRREAFNQDELAKVKEPPDAVEVRIRHKLTFSKVVIE